MTFDDAIDMIDVNGTLIDTLGVLQALQQEYAPTVEMTEEQNNVIEYTKENISSSELPRIIHDGDEGEWSLLDEFSGRLFGHQPGGMTDKNIEDIMRIWLHPETIKIVDE